MSQKRNDIKNANETIDLIQKKLHLQTENKEQILTKKEMLLERTLSLEQRNSEVIL